MRSPGAAVAVRDLQTLSGHLQRGQEAIGLKCSLVALQRLWRVRLFGWGVTVASFVGSSDRRCA